MSQQENQQANNPARVSPKQKFRQSASRISGHRELIASDQFDAAADAALLEYQHQLTNTTPPDFTGCAGNYLRLLGAQEFLKIFKLMGEEATLIPLPKPAVNLDHRTS